MPVPGMALWWFVGVTTALTKRDTQVGVGRLGLVGRWPTAGLVGNFVTARGESCSLATLTGLAGGGCDRPMLVGMNVRRAL